MSSWDNSSEYPSLTSPEIEADFTTIQVELQELESLSKALAPWVTCAKALTDDEASAPLDLAWRIARIEDCLDPLFYNILTYCHCTLSVDSDSAEAKKAQARLSPLSSRHCQAVETLYLFLDYLPETRVEEFLVRPGTPALRFLLLHRRKVRNRLLPLEQESLIQALTADGHSAWAALYSTVSGSLVCELDLPSGKTSMGIARASGLLKSPSPAERKASWLGVNRAWETQQETCASILNSIAGWRHELDGKRSHTEQVHFLDSSLHESKIRPETLNAMLEATERFSGLSRRALKAQAKALGTERLAPWDLQAPAPGPSKGLQDAKLIPYEKALDVIATAFERVHPDMRDFVHMMEKNHWIEAGNTGKRRPGAYCTGFLKSRTPRVYMTYMGSIGCLKTLAHELGHAYHNWVMRDLPYQETEYPMTLAETASIFSESLVHDDLTRLAVNDSERLAIAWNEVAGAATMTLNIPARFDFERNFYEARRVRALTHAEITTLMVNSWNRFYGDALSEPDPMFWASKLHFYMTGRSFYNYPYLFGYLFSTGIYARRKALGSGFHSAYVSLLRDTGKMGCEELAARHLDTDLTRPEFWQQSLSIMEARILEFEMLVSSS